ncbi:phosphotransacetylase family protein [Haloarcula onubensis]|uniref:Phosphotransacetylase family protein n=1 Tax=Haloarcula onubensis TaxID=2950539 RepID=A0ABU2FJM1_9EURY|nr:phosphotransacetylase family protein [Halomicroarcula sp. S3CR25-11]MDS0280960.1 phosphotransacetylase family protein [Halomicroarcula sp. S3CR25-11]
MRSILLTATSEGCGKTGIALGLALAATDRGYAVSYMKPKGTRLQSHEGRVLDTDPLLARDLLGLDADIDDMEPVVYSPTFVDQAIRDTLPRDDLTGLLRERFETLADDRDLVVLEGGGSYTTGGVVELTDADVAAALDADVVLVAPFADPADIDGVLAAAADLGDRLAGVLFNPVPDAQFDYVEEAVVPFLESRGVPVVGILPRVKALAGVPVAELADHLNATVLTDTAPTERTVERFLVGAMSGESALRYFRRTRDAAVITGGDRSDLLSVALEAGGVTCVILTGGHPPADALVSKAQRRDVPLLLVQADTLTTVERGEELVRSGRVRDAGTVQTVRDLLADHADLDALVGPGAQTGE